MKRTLPNFASYFQKYNDPFFGDGLWLWKKHNIDRCWDYAYSGKNVVISILDDGLEHQHPDLKQNYFPQGSYDVNDGDWDPTPRYNRLNTNRHGTRCAGVVSAKADNSICIPGIAHKSKIAGIRMLDGIVNVIVVNNFLRNNRLTLLEASAFPFACCVPPRGAVFVHNSG